MRHLLSLIFLFGAVQARAAVDFDRGVSPLAELLRAAESVLPPAPQPGPLADDRVWISAESEDAGALQAAFKRGPVARNETIHIYELREDDLPRAAAAMFRTYRRGPGFFAHGSLAAALEDLAPPASPQPRAFTLDQQAKVRPLLDGISEDGLISMIKSLSAYKNRNYKSATGIAAVKWLYGQWQALAEGHPEVSVELFKHAAFPQESVILTVRGAVEPEKVVVLGGHSDSIAGGNENPAPGADDNASGVAVTNEVARVLLQGGYRPAQTLKFIAFAAEEVGLRGSGEVAAAFKRDGVQVQGMLNLDMVNYKGSAKDIYFVGDNSSAGQNAFLGQLIEAYTPYTWATIKCGYACSDHASWTKNGYHASMPFESEFKQYNPSVHTANDTLAQTGGRAEHAVKFARLAAAYAVEMAK